MPWKTLNVMDQKLEFVSIARTHITTFKTLCKQYGISRTTGYKWLGRSKNSSSVNINLTDLLKEQSRVPKHSPSKTLEDIEQKIVLLRKQYPYWGAKKIMILLKEQNQRLKIPAVRTINRIFRRNNLLDENSPQGKEYKRFEYGNPNDLWQMDNKGEFLYDKKYHCYPLNILDDHSRYNIAFKAHPKLAMELTQFSLIDAFKSFGLPNQMLMDRGGLWYSAHGQNHWTKLTVWLMRLRINVIHSRGYHPQTLGKTERSNRTFKYDYIQRTNFSNFNTIQPCFNNFHYEYNHVRPHEALGFKHPAQCYTKSNRPFPNKLPSIEYPKGAMIKKLTRIGTLYYKKRYWFISEALANQPVFLKEQDGKTEVFFVKTLVKTLNLRGAC